MNGCANGSGHGAVLCIGGMDSSGGAGLLRDCATLADLHVGARVAVTAVTAQSVRAVTAIHPVPSDVLTTQIRAAGPVGGVKIGMLGTGRAVTTVAQALSEELPKVPVVLDPVLAASSGRALLDRAGRERLIAELLPMTHLLTPNLPELAILGDMLGVKSDAEAAQVAALLRRGCHAVLVKGGHRADPAICEDRLYLGTDAPLRFSSARIATTLRGTGCQLASAIAGTMLRGATLPEAVAKGKRAVLHRLQGGDRDHAPGS